MFHSLRNFNYRLYFAGAAVSNIGTWVQRIAQDWLVLELTNNSGTALGITTGLQFLPFLLFGPLGGNLADRFSKRKVLQICLAGAGVTAAVLAVLDLTNIAQVWHVYVLAFLLGLADALGHPSRQSFVVEMVGKDDLTNAVALNSASFNGARVVGPAIAGVLIVLVGTGWVIMINAVSYAAIIFVLSRMRESQLTPSEPVPRTKGMTREGLRYLRGRRDLQLLLWTVFFAGCFGMNFQLTSALMATEAFDKGAGEFGVLASIMAVGAVAGALLAARRTDARLRVIVFAAILFGLITMISGLMPTYATFAMVLPLQGLFSMTMITTANALMQLAVVPEMRGRTMAVYSMVFIGSKPLGSPLLGWIGDVLGPRWPLLVGGFACVVGPLVAAYLLAIRRKGRGLNGSSGTGMSVLTDKVAEWRIPVISHYSRSTPHGSQRLRRAGSIRRSRRVRAGRSVTS